MRCEPLADVDRFAEERLGLFELTLVNEKAGQRIHRVADSQRLGALRAADTQGLAEHLLGGLVVALCHQQHAESAERAADVRIVVGGLLAPQLQRLAEEGLGRLEVAGRLQLNGPAAERGRDGRVIRAEDLAGGFQHALDVHVGGERLVGIGGDEQCLQEVGDPLGASRFLVRLDEADHRQREAGEQRRGDDRRRRHAETVTRDEPPQLVEDARRAGEDGLATQVPQDVGRELVGRLVSPRAILLDRLHDDPVDVAADRAAQVSRVGALQLADVGAGTGERVDACRGSRRLLLLDDALDLPVPGLAECDRVEGGCAGEQLVEKDAQRVDVGACVDIEAADLRLVRAHVLRRADEVVELGEQCFLGEPRTRRLGDAEVDHLRDRLGVVQRDEHVRWLDVTVDDALLVRVLDGVADLHEQVQPLPHRELGLVTVLGDGDALDKLHHEVRPACLGGAGLQHRRDVRVIHHRQRLPLGLEPRDHLLGVHAELDDLQGDPASDRVLLLGHVHDAEAALADLLEDLVRADLCARPLRQRPAVDDRLVLPARRSQPHLRGAAVGMGQQ